MRTIIVMILCVIGLNVTAQQRYKGQWSCSVKGGINTNNGYYGSISAENYRNYNSSYGLSVSILESKYNTINNFKFAVRQYLVGGKYIYSFNVASPIYVNLGAGLLLGYENPPTHTLENKQLKYDSQFNIGVDFAPQIEFSLHRSFSLFAEARVMYLFSTNFENFITAAAAGVKVYF